LLSFSDLEKITGHPVRQWAGTGKKYEWWIIEKACPSATVALGQAFSKYFSFPCQFSVHQLLHIH
jgi:hypothetical protein